MAGNPELALMELEQRLLDMADAAWDEYQNSETQGIPPMAVVNITIRAHETIAKRIKAKLGVGFDTDNPEMALIELDRMRQLLLRKVEQRAKLRGTVS